MKKKLLSIFLSLSLIFSSITSMSVAFAEGGSSTEKVVQQDGIEVRMDMKAGTYFNVFHKWGNYDVKQKFEAGPEMDNSSYNGWQIMKVVIDIPKKDGLIVDEITPMQNDEGVPENIKNNYPDYFVMKESQDKYSYNYYFLKNGEYKFKIKYTLNGATKETVVKYEANDLVSIEDLYMRVYLIENCKGYGGNYENKYLTKTFLSTVLTQDAFGEKIGFSLGNDASSVDPYEKIVPKIKSLDGIQYFSDNLKSITLSGPYGFNSIESIAPIAEGYYPSLDTFTITVEGDSRPTIPQKSYSSDLIAKCILKMPKLQAFYCKGSGFKDFGALKNLKGHLNDIYASNNGITSVNDIGELGDLSYIGISGNHIFDLTPLKKCDRPDGTKCEAMNQTVYIEEKILAIEENNKIKIELPMPIDIDGTLTDVNKKIVTAKYGKETKEFEVKDDGDKKYIEIDNTEFGGKVVDDIENIEFSFNFNNDSGNDERTRGKFNGVVNFKAGFTPPKKEKATVSYEAKNTSENRRDEEVDKNILDVENIDVSKYIKLPGSTTEDVGTIVKPKENPKAKIKIDENGKVIGNDIYLAEGESTLAEYVEPNKKIKTYVRLTFEGYEPEELEVKAGEENKFIGKFKLEDMEEINYQLKTDKGEDIPDKIKEEFKKIKEHEICLDGKVIKPDMPEHTEISDSNGTWIFKGWIHKDGEEYAYLPEEGVEVHNDDEFIGVWHFEPKSTGGGTGGGGTITPTPNPNPTPDKEDPDRIEGDDRIETSIEASKDLYPNGTNAVVLANAERFSDVLTANPFAIQEKASALLTYKDKLPEKTLKEIERLGAKKIYISGGYEAVSKKVVGKLAAKGYEIYRFDGLDRYDTARKIAIKIREKGNKEVVELASGENYPDALCMTSMAVKDHAPILLTKKDSIPKYTKQALAEWDIENVKIAGLEKAISREVQNQIDKGFEITKGNKADSNVYDGAKSVSRFGGKDRYETSTIVAANSCPESRLGVYATGEDFPDALIAGNYAGRKEAPVLLVRRDTLPEVVEKYTTNSRIEKATVFGGVNAVSDKVFNLIKVAINK